MKVLAHKTFPPCPRCVGTIDPSGMDICPDCGDTGSLQVWIGRRTGRDNHLTGNWPRNLPAWRNPDGTPRYNAFVLKPDPEQDVWGVRFWRLVCVIDRPLVKRGRRVGNQNRSGVDGHGRAITSALVADDVTVSGRVEALNHYDDAALNMGDGDQFDAVVQVNDDPAWPTYFKCAWVAQPGRHRGHITLRSKGYVLDKRAMRAA